MRPTTLAAALAAGLCALSSEAACAQSRIRFVELAWPAPLRADGTAPRLTAAQLQAAWEPAKQALSRRHRHEVLEAYPHLPLLRVRLADDAMEAALANDPVVVAVSPEPVLTTQITATASANQMQAALARGAGLSGVGTSVLVTDAALDATAPTIIHPDFGTCTAVGVPESCQLASWTVGDPAGSDDHGTNVAAIVARTAHGTRIHFHDVGTADDGGRGISSSLAFSALNWAIANRDALNIVAHNMSWGGSSACSFAANVFLAGKAAGIVQVAASGNAGASSLLWPACSPHVESVGALSTTSANFVVAGYSNVAANLDFVAPGSSIEAGGYTLTGTSMAAPHVSGAFAILAASGAWSSLGPDALAAQMRAQARYISLTRGGIDYSFAMPQIFDARPLALHIDNRFDAAWSLSPAPPQSCGDECAHYSRNTTVSVATTTPGITLLHCADAGVSTCTHTLAGPHTISLMPTTVLAALPDLLATSTKRGREFSDGFEP
jgi:hypothetical protein